VLIERERDCGEKSAQAICPRQNGDVPWCHRVRNNAYLLSRVYVTPRGPRLIRLRGGFKLDYQGRWKRSRGGWANLRYA